jgi:hypothetical protein
MQNVILTVQAAAVETCKFLPTVDTVSSLISAYNLEVGAAFKAAGAIAQKICDTVLAAPPKTADVEGQPVKEWTLVTEDGEAVTVKGDFTDQMPGIPPPN